MFILFLTLGSFLVLAQVDSLAFWDGTAQDALQSEKTINNGDGIGLTVGGESFQERAMRIETTLLQNGRVLVTLFEGRTTGDALYEHVDVTPTDYHEPGTYTIRTVVTGETSGRTATDDLILHVEQGRNDPPVFDRTTTQDKNINEWELLRFRVRATDPNGNTITLSAQNLPRGAQFTPQSGELSWTPDFTQGNNDPTVYTVRFTARDSAGATVTADVRINVFNVNRNPVLNPIGDKTVPEGQTLTFTVSGSDPDGDRLTFSTGQLPAGATFDPVSKTFSWTPDFDQAGTYRVTFRVTDGNGGADSETITIIVTENGNGNHPPVLNPIGDQTVNEGEQVQLRITATDQDGDRLNFTVAGLPSGATFADQNNGTASLIWTPDFTQAGEYTVTITVADEHGATDAETITITVVDRGNGNSCPVFDPMENSYEVLENEEIQIPVRATDADGDIIVLSIDESVVTIPEGATFTDNGDGTGMFTWTPDFGQHGSYHVFFEASDGNCDPVVRHITVVVKSAINYPPELEPVENQDTFEGVEVQFTLHAEDQDADDTITYSADNLPPGATLSLQTGEFLWTPTFTQGDNDPTDYTITFTATDRMGEESDPVTVIISVYDGNPTIGEIPDQEVDEGNELTFTVRATDPADAVIIFQVDELPQGAHVQGNPDGTVTFSWTPDFTQGDDDPTEYPVTFTATNSNGGESEPEVVTIRVNDVPSDPVITIPQEQYDIDEGELLQIPISAADPQGEAIVLTADNLPRGAVFMDNGDNTASFTWTPDFTQGNNDPTMYENIIIHAVDADGQESEKNFTVRVFNVNRAPHVDTVRVIPNPAAEEQKVTITVTFSDPDQDHLFFSFNWANDLPGDVPAVEISGDNEVSLTWQTDLESAGVHDFEFTVFDRPWNDEEHLEDVEIIPVTVTNVNQKPTIHISSNDVVMNEEETRQLLVSASDTDNDRVTLTLTDVVGLTDEERQDVLAVLDFNPRTKVITLSPSFDFVDHPALDKEFTIEFKATDQPADGSQPLEETVEMRVKVQDVNRNPEFREVNDIIVNAGDNVEFEVQADDLDGDDLRLRYTVEDLPPGGTFGQGADQGFTWTPQIDQVGTYEMTFIVSDAFGGSDTMTVRITVVDGTGGDYPPIFDEIPDQEGDEGQELTFAVTATDQDAEDILTYSADDLPAGAIFDLETQTFTWTPDFDQAGEYDVTFTVSDGRHTDTMDVHITINNVNRPPVFDQIPEQTIAEQDTIKVIVNAVDPDGDSLVYSTGDLPNGATFDPEMKTFTWTPDLDQAGDYEITFFVTDGTAGDQEVLLIHVGNTNQGPTIADIPDQTIGEGETATIIVEATDNDGDPLTFGADNLPAGATFEPVSRTFTWTPDFEQAGTYEVTFTVTDGSVTVEETVLITVTNTNRPPRIISQPVLTAEQGKEYVYTVIAVDPDQDPLTYELLTSPEGMKISPTGKITWTPDITRREQVVIAVSDGEFIVTQKYVIVVRGGYQHLDIAAIHIQEDVAPGQVIPIQVVVDNEGNVDLENLQIRVTIPELGIRRAGKIFDLDSREEMSETLQLHLPDVVVEEGAYTVHVSVGNDLFHDLGHREIYFGSN